MKSIDYITRAIKYFLKKEMEITEKGFVKLLQDEKETTLHYIQSDDKLLALTLKTSDKVDAINNNIPTQLSFAKKDQTNLIDANIKIIHNQATVKQVFDQMLALNFTHFKAYSNDLVVLEITMTH
ncbi:MAG: hypothetical protein ACRCV7_04305 [Culicoidibacterales bacterium]